MIAVYDFQSNYSSYSAPAWTIAEILALFGMVLMHEFGHALACRSVGGKSDTIVLWPLGGVAYVDPPQRAGATLWSIVAGPLVNVVLVPITSIVYFIARKNGLADSVPDAFRFIHAIWRINIGLLIFNMLPIYPLDGGQILRSLLWFVLGKARSLFVATIIGFVGVAVLVAFAVWAQSVWIGIMAAFILMNCWTSLRYAQALSKFAKLPKHTQFTCPSCKTSPPMAPLWMCNKCGARLDVFASNAMCPGCGQGFATTRCFECHESAPIAQWSAEPASPPIINV
jgi:Zn-dependent protease